MNARDLITEYGLVLTVFVEILLGIVWVSYVFSPAPLSAVQPNITKQITFNINDGVLLMSVTFSDPQYANPKVFFGRSIIYTKYNISNVSLTFPNGTMIRPSTPYIKNEFQLFCNSYLYKYFNKTTSVAFPNSQIEYNCS
jgi:hypothetical protein